MIGKIDPLVQDLLAKVLSLSLSLQVPFFSQGHFFLPHICPENSIKNKISKIIILEGDMAMSCALTT